MSRYPYHVPLLVPRSVLSTDVTRVGRAKVRVTDNDRIRRFVFKVGTYDTSVTHRPIRPLMMMIHAPS